MNKVMRAILFFLLFSYTACTLPEKNKKNQLAKKPDTTIIETSDEYSAAKDTVNSVSIPPIPKTKNPEGIYRVQLPLNQKMEQIVLFNNDLTYRLEEKYLNGKKDSVVITEGNWAPSDGFIWLYKDQIVRGRYKWKGDTLQYYNPVVKKGFSMNRLQDAMQNTVWRKKDKQGIVVFGVGNEPFWNIELNNKDSVSFSLAEWDHPLRLKIDTSFSDNDGIAYTAHHDSVQIRVTVFPHFCSDGMSDYIYPDKVKVQYNHQEYNGCGIVYKQ